MEIKKSLKNGLKDYKKQKLSIFSMPGHKGNYPPLKKTLNLKYDLTELDNTDSLFSSYENNENGIIGQTEKKLESFYQSGYSIISAGGSTACIQTILCVLKKFGNSIIVNRNCHVSVINACALLNINIIWVIPEIYDNYGVSGKITKKMIETAFSNNKNENIGGIFITSPDYFGNVCQGQEISSFCKENNLIFCVDNAHGAHLKLFTQHRISENKMPLHPLDFNADLCCDSSHKTLPALTGSAYLHVSKAFKKHNPWCNKEFLKTQMSLFCSTSPSYLIMQSIDVCCDYLLSSNAKKDYLILSKKIEQIKTLAISCGFKVFKDENIDLCRISLFYNNPIFLSILKKQKIEVEYKNEDYCILIPTPFNKRKDFIKLKKALKKYNCSNIHKDNLTILFDKKSQSNNIPKKAMSITDAMLSQNQIISLEKALGRIAAQTKSFCPPGIAPVIPGEIIDENIIKKLKSYGISYIKVVK